MKKLWPPTVISKTVLIENTNGMYSRRSISYDDYTTIAYTPLGLTIKFY